MWRRYCFIKELAVFISLDFNTERKMRTLIPSHLETVHIIYVGFLLTHLNDLIAAFPKSTFQSLSVVHKAVISTVLII